MGNHGYLSFFNTTGSSGHTALFSTSKGGETAGSVAANYIFSSSSKIASLGGETAGSVASSSGGSFSSGGCSFTAIA